MTDSVSAITTMGLTIAVNATQTYTISGHVTIASCPLSGVNVALTGGGNPQTQTDATGSYSFAGLAAGTYTVDTSKTGYTFTPTPAPFSLTGNQTMDFTANGPVLPSASTSWRAAAWSRSRTAEASDSQTTLSYVCGPDRAWS